MPYLYEEVPLSPFTVLVLAALRERFQIGRLLTAHHLKNAESFYFKKYFKQSKC